MFLIVLGATEIFSRSCLKIRSEVDLLTLLGAELGLGKHYWQISLSEGTLILKVSRLSMRNLHLVDIESFTMSPK